MSEITDKRDQLNEELKDDVRFHGVGISGTGDNKGLVLYGIFSREQVDEMECRLGVSIELHRMLGGCHTL